MQIVECVPNFSEGRDNRIITQITEAIASVKGVQLLHVDMGESANRTVVTFIGTPESIDEAAFRGIEQAASVIDMRYHSGNHPRIGATDVCPFIPVQNISMEAVDRVARQVAERVGQTLKIPVYLYENSATASHRKNLANIRRGDYEGIPEKLRQANWQPDFGPARCNEEAGATVIGAREFLIAYNINLDTRDVRIARTIAAELRTSGRLVRTRVPTASVQGTFSGENIKNDSFACGTCDYQGGTFEELASHTEIIHGYILEELLDARGLGPGDLQGKASVKPGLFPHVKALGWYVEEYGCAQVSMNLTNYRETPPHRVFQAAKSAAQDYGVQVTGSEIIGLIPYDALRLAGEFYLEQQGLSGEASAETIIQTAVESLGLDDKTPFKVEQKVLGLPGRDIYL